MAVCTFDNPATMHREAYADGKLVASISAAQMLTKGFNGHRNMFFGLNVGREFIEGNVVGDESAILSNHLTKQEGESNGRW